MWKSTLANWILSRLITPDGGADIHFNGWTLHKNAGAEGTSKVCGKLPLSK